MPKDGAVPPAAASAQPARRCRAATSTAGPSHVTGADESLGRRRAARGKTSAKQRKKPSKDSAEDKAGDTGPWPALPHTVLCQVLALLDHEDVVSVGQTCRSWRETALHRDVWRKRVLEYQVTDYRNKHFSYGWHDNAKRFSRIARFAPCAAKVSCNRGMKPAARKALFTQSKCQPKEVELNGGTVAAAKYLQKWKDGIEDVTLLNPTLQCLEAAISLPNLASLAIMFKFDGYKQTYQVPSYEGPGSATLKKLVFFRNVHFAAVDSLIRAHAATLEDVSVICFPGTALAVCARLRRLLLDVDPETQGDELLALLRGKNPLDHLAFWSFGYHNADPCTALRRRLRDEGLVQQDVTCDSCERGGPIVDDLHRSR